jgi:hypothetical protein
MTGNNVAVISAEELAAFDAASGASKEALTGGGDFIPSLKVMYDEPDEDTGLPNHIGKFFVTGDNPVYAKKVNFRPLVQNFQWVQWDDVAKKVVNKTKYISSLFKDEARDELGTVKCGKPPSKELKADPKLAELYDDITTFRNVHGLVWYVGDDADGNEVNVPPTLVTLRLKGANWAPFQEEVIDEMPKGSKIYEFEMKLSAKKEKNGASTYYVVHFDPDFNQRLPMTVDVFETCKGLTTRFDEINKEIDFKYYKAIENRNKSDKAVDALDLEVVHNPLEDDMNDSIPF